MAVTAYKFPATIADDTTVGTVGWANHANAGADDTSEAAWEQSSGSPVGYYLKGTNFGFTTADVPSGATIDGLEAEVRRREQSTTDNISDNSVKYVDAGTITGNEKAAAGEWTQATGESSAGNATYGGAADLWGATISDSDARASTSGLAFSPKATSGTTPDGYVDYMKIRYYYTEAPASTFAPRVMMI